jgi:hypothetical protein
MILATAIYEAGKRAGEVYEGYATTGSAVSLTDSLLPTMADDFFNGGTLCILSGTSIGTTRIITDYIDSTHTFMFALDPAIAAGVRYAAIRPTLTRAQIISAINAALGEMGNVTQINDTLTVTANTEQYSLPSGVRNVARVQVATATTAPYGWEDNYQWREVNGALIFTEDSQPTDTGKHIRVYYNQPHAEVTLDADVISADIAPVRWAGCPP